jgi:mono/diheme cytochrome c family protein
MMYNVESKRRVWLVTVSAMIFSIVSMSPARAQDQSQATVLKRVPVQQNGEIAGSKLFATYCAPCHGVDAKGNGPAAPALKSIPPDLTMLAKYKGDIFPSAHVMTVLTGQSEDAAHRTKDMPAWGPLFRSMAGQSDQGAYLRARNVTEYLRSIQAH